MKRPVKPRKPLTRKTPLKSRSALRTSQEREYGRLRAEFLKDYPACFLCGAPPVEIHHMCGRGKHYLDKKTWMSICRPCHERIHQNVAWARERGYIQYDFESE